MKSWWNAINILWEETTYQYTLFSRNYDVPFGKCSNYKQFRKTWQVVSADIGIQKDELHIWSLSHWQIRCWNPQISRAYQILSGFTGVCILLYSFAQVLCNHKCIFYALGWSLWLWEGIHRDNEIKWFPWLLHEGAWLRRQKSWCEKPSWEKQTCEFQNTWHF